MNRQEKLKRVLNAHGNMLFVQADIDSRYNMYLDCIDRNCCPGLYAVFSYNSEVARIYKPNSGWKLSTDLSVGSPFYEMLHQMKLRVEPLLERRDMRGYYIVIVLLGIKNEKD